MTLTGIVILESYFLLLNPFIVGIAVISNG
jgi:hypothetical protein